jgi:hypothetical protein
MFVVVLIVGFVAAEKKENVRGKSPKFECY